MNKIESLKISLTLPNLINIILGAVFLLSGFMKIINITDFMDTVESYNIFPSSIVLYLSVILCVIELTIGFSVLFGIFPKAGIVGVIVLMIIFNTLTLWSIMNDKGWVCRCFGDLFKSQLNYSSLLRNLFILIGGVYIFYKKSFISFANKLSPQKFDLLIIAFLIFISAFLFAENISNSSSKELKVGDSFPTSMFNNVLNSKFKVPSENTKYILVVVFSLNDCPDCLTEARMWKEITNDFYKNIKVLGIAYANNEHQLKSFIDYYGISFPIIYDWNKKFIGKYVTHTPVKLLCDNTTKIVGIEKSIGSKTAQRDYIHYLNGLLTNNNIK